VRDALDRIVIANTFSPTQPGGGGATVEKEAKLTSSGQAKGLIRIREIAGKFEGKIDKIFPKAGDDPAPRCEKCEGSLHNQPVLGLTFLWGFTKQGDEYQGGEILDPESGKVYQAKMKLVDGGKKLEVRGFIGFSLFGRSQTWLREE